MPVGIRLAQDVGENLTFRVSYTHLPGVKYKWGKRQYLINQWHSTWNFYQSLKTSNELNECLQTFTFINSFDVLKHLEYSNV